MDANPGPVKAAMAAMGLLEESYRLPVVAPQPAAKQQIAAVLTALDLLKVSETPATTEVSLNA